MKKIGKIIFYLILTFILLIGFIYISKLEFLFAPEVHFNNDIKNRIEQGEEKIYLRDLTDFEWEKACYLDYSVGHNFNNEELTEFLGFKYKGGNYPYQSCDSSKFNAIIFIGPGQSAEIINVELCITDTGQENGYRRDPYYCFDRGVYFKIYKDSEQEMKKHITLIQGKIDGRR